MIDRLTKKLDSQSKVLLKNSSWVLAGNGLKTGLSLLKSIVVARYLGLETFGLFIIIAQFTGLIQQIIQLPIGVSVVKFGAKYKAENQLDRLVALLKFSYLSGIILGVFALITVMILIHFSYDTFINRPGLELHILGYAFVTCSSFIDMTTKSILRLFSKFKATATLHVIAGSIELIILAATLYIFPKDFNAFLIAFIVAAGINAFVLNTSAYFILHDSLHKHLGTSISLIKEELKEFIKFTLTNSISKIEHTIIKKGDVLLLTLILGPVTGALASGVYHIGKKLAQLLYNVLDPLASTLYPQLATLIAEKRYSEIYKMLARMSSIAAVLCLCVALGSFLLGQWAIDLVYGAEYKDVYFAFLILLTNTLLATTLFWSTPLLLSLGLVKFRLGVHTVALGIGALLAYLLVEQYEEIGISIAFASANIFIVLCLSIITIRKVSRLKNTNQSS